MLRKVFRHDLSNYSIEYLSYGASLKRISFRSRFLNFHIEIIQRRPSYCNNKNYSIKISYFGILS